MKKIIKNSMIIILAIAIFSATFVVDFESVKAANPWDPWASVFDPAYYVNTYDVKAKGITDPNALWAYFLQYGMVNGDQASAEFNIATYKYLNPDLVAVFGEGKENNVKYYVHYATTGKAEGRKAEFTKTTSTTSVEGWNSTNWGTARNAAVKAKCESYRATNGGMDCDVYGNIPHLIGCMERNYGVNYDDKIAKQGGYYDVELAKATYKYMAEKYGYSTTEMNPLYSGYAVRAKELCFNGFHHGSWMATMSSEIITRTSANNASPEAIERIFYNSPMHRMIMEEGGNYVSIYIYGSTMYVAIR